MWTYAADHEGKFPPREAIEERLWRLSDDSDPRFLYVPGLTRGATSRLLVCEPVMDGQDRLVLYADGQVGALTTAQIDEKLAREAKQ